MRIFSLFLLCFTCAFAAGELSNRRAPGFSLPENAAKSHDPQDYRGKILIVDFMQVACPHCDAFSVILEQVKAKYRDKIVVLSIVNPPSDPKAVSEYIAKNKITTPILFDCGQVTYSYMKPSGPQIIIPHVFLIDEAGVIKNDFGYSPANSAIFEGKGLFTEIDKMLAPK